MAYFTPDELKEKIEELDNLQSELQTLAEFAAKTAFEKQVIVRLIRPEGHDECIVGVSLDQIIDLMIASRQRLVSELQNAKLNMEGL